jgi:hypothetical protein
MKVRKSQGAQGASRRKWRCGCGLFSSYDDCQIAGAIGFARFNSLSANQKHPILVGIRRGCPKANTGRCFPEEHLDLRMEPIREPGPSSRKARGEAVCSIPPSDSAGLSRFSSAEYSMFNTNSKKASDQRMESSEACSSEAIVSLPEEHPARFTRETIRVTSTAQPIFIVICTHLAQMAPHATPALME